MSQETRQIVHVNDFNQFLWDKAIENAYYEWLPNLIPEEVNRSSRIKYKGYKILMTHDYARDTNLIIPITVSCLIVKYTERSS